MLVVDTVPLVEGWSLGLLRGMERFSFNIKHRATFLILFVAFMVMTGCSTLEEIDVDSQLSSVDSMAGGRRPESPLPVRVGVLPLVVDEAFGAYLRQTNGNEELHRWVQEVDSAEAALIRKRIVRTLEASRVFESVGTLDSATLDDAYDDAWRSDLDLVMVPRIVHNDVYYIDSNGRWTWNFLLWGFLTPIASWWVADEEFGADVRVELTAYSVGQRAELFRDEITGEAQHSLDDWDQGWEWLSIFTTPSTLNAPNWREISPVLRPHGELDMYKNMVSYARRDVVGVQDLTGRLSKFEAIVAWSRPKGWVEPRYVEDDARNVAEMLTQREFALAPVQLRASLTKPATASFLREAIARASRRLKSYDRLMLYFSGTGTMNADADGALVLGDPSSPDALITLDELSRMLDDVSARTLVVIDVGFGGTRTTRTAPHEGSEPEADIFAPLRDLENACFYIASPPDGGALEMEEIRAGLFTYFLTQTVAEFNEAEKALELRALFEEVSKRVTRYAGLEGVAQSPHMIVGDDFDVRGFFPGKGKTDADDWPDRDGDDEEPLPEDDERDDPAEPDDDDDDRPRRG